jgi:hypothetical protein
MLQILHRYIKRYIPYPNLPRCNVHLNTWFNRKMPSIRVSNNFAPLRERCTAQFLDLPHLAPGGHSVHH